MGHEKNWKSLGNGSIHIILNKNRGEILINFIL